MNTREPAVPSDDPAVGLCARCVHAHVIVSTRDSRFWRCRLSDADARFPRYPRLPVVDCRGFADSRRCKEIADDSSKDLA